MQNIQKLNFAFSKNVMKKEIEIESLKAQYECTQCMATTFNVRYKANDPLFTREIFFLFHRALNEVESFGHHHRLNCFRFFFLSFSRSNVNDSINLVKRHHFQPLHLWSIRSMKHINCYMDGKDYFGFLWIYHLLWALMEEDIWW